MVGEAEAAEPEPEADALSEAGALVEEGSAEVELEATAALFMAVAISLGNMRGLVFATLKSIDPSLFITSVFEARKALV